MAISRYSGRMKMLPSTCESLWQILTKVSRYSWLVYIKTVAKTKDQMCLAQYFLIEISGERNGARYMMSVEYKDSIHCHNFKLFCIEIDKELRAEFLEYLFNALMS